MNCFYNNISTYYVGFLKLYRLYSSIAYSFLLYDLSITRVEIKYCFYLFIYFFEILGLFFTTQIVTFNDDPLFINYYT